MIFKLAHGLRHQVLHVVAHLERAEAWNSCRVGKIPLVFRKADEVTNGWIRAPSAAQSGLCQFRRHARL
jgi:hypothetical protein